jgi:hypothetical protein
MPQDRVSAGLRDALSLNSGGVFVITSNGIGDPKEPGHSEVVEQNGHLVVKAANGRAITDDEIFQTIDACRRPAAIDEW